MSLILPPPDTGPVSFQAAADHLALAARSSATLRAYHTDWKTFVIWCDAQNVTALPAYPNTVAAWIADRMDQGLKAATLTRGIAAISCAHELAGYESFSRSRIVQDALKGMRRILGTAPTRKAPATVGLMRQMLAAQPDSLIGLRNRALLALGFAGALRRSELVTLEVKDLAPQEGGALLTLRRSKTDPDGSGQTIGILNGSTIRALDHLDTWCEVSGITSGLLFRSIDRHGRVGGSLSDRSVARIVKAGAKAIGLDPEIFSGHSLRAGFITSGAEAGVDALLIAETSRHKSLDVLRRYVRHASLLKVHAGQRFL
ncbi:site-specific integrase [Asaia spathodeae]|uniref:site-specific integrase n=1 Tax=Asaia spathodeae TaxID=657016 RepID=UPI002FC2B3D2